MGAWMLAVVGEARGWERQESVWIRTLIAEV